MARTPKRSKTELAKQACEATYDGFTQDTIKEEIARLNKVNFSLVEDKKATTKSMNEVIKENVNKIEFLVEKLDHVRHEVMVAHQLEQAAE